MTTSEIYQYGTAILDQYLILIALILVALAIVIYLGRNKINQSWRTIKMRYRLKRLGVKQVSNFQFPDGLGHYFTVDRLVMRHDGISLLVFKQYPGSIFCADNIGEWTQMLGGKSYRFKNPLVELDYQVKAISASVPDVPVDGFVFFDYQASFPKGHPDRVIQFDELPESLRRNKQNKIQAGVESAWEELITFKAA